jgi:hypothetical protein
MDAPDPFFPRADVSMYDLAEPLGGWTGIVVGPRLVLTVAHSDIADSDVVVIDAHDTYAEQIVGAAGGTYTDVIGEVARDWLLVSTAQPPATSVAKILFNAAPAPGTRVRIIGRARDRASDAPLRRCSADGTVVNRPPFVPEMEHAIYVRTKRIDVHGFSGGPVMLTEGPDAGRVVGMFSEGYQSLIGLPETIFVARRIDPSMVVPTIEGRRFVVLGRGLSDTLP